MSPLKRERHLLSFEPAFVLMVPLPNTTSVGPAMSTGRYDDAGLLGISRSSRHFFTDMPSLNTEL